MTHIPQQAIKVFEAGIYLPMLLTVIDRDLTCIEEGNFKFKEPYIQLLSRVRQNIEEEFLKAKQSFKKEKMKLKRGLSDALFTEYYFYYGELIELRRYSNIRLRNQSEWLLMQFMLHEGTTLASLAVD